MDHSYLARFLLEAVSGFQTVFYLSLLLPLLCDHFNYSSLTALPATLLQVIAGDYQAEKDASHQSDFILQNSVVLLDFLKE